MSSGAALAGGTEHSDGAGHSGTAGGPHAAGGDRRGLVLFLVCAALPAALLTTMIAVPAALWSRLPALITDHWTITGAANGTGPRLASLAGLAPIALLGGALVLTGWAMARRGVPRAGEPGVRRDSRRWPAAGVAAALISFGLFMTALGTAVTVMVTVANLGDGGPRSASVPPWSLIGAIGGPALLAALAGYVLRRHAGLGATDDGSARASLGLRAGERAVWRGRARAWWPWPTGLLALMTGLGLLDGATASWPFGAALLAVGVACALTLSSVRVTVAARGVAVGYGVLGLRLTRIPLHRIARAEATDWTGLSFGYRGSLLVLGSAWVVLRRGPALRLVLRDGKTFTVTVDDAATGAALLNDLLAAAN